MTIHSYLKGFLVACTALAAVAMVRAYPTTAMQIDGCGAGACKDCHSLTEDEAKGLLKDFVDEVKSVKFAEVGGLWEVDVVANGNRVPVFIDFSKQFLLSGQVIRIATRENITQKRLLEMNTVDLKGIPLDDAVVIGDPKAARRVIVFDDPECPFCIKLHAEIKKVVSEDPSIAFYIKMFPLKIHPNAYDKARAIACEKSLALLDDSFAGKELPPPSCQSDVVDRNIELAGKLNIKSTPTLILPNGLVMPGYKSAEDIRKILDSLGTPAKKP